jgi:hypothetical protein
MQWKATICHEIQVILKLKNSVLFDLANKKELQNFKGTQLQQPKLSDPLPSI